MEISYSELLEVKIVSGTKDYLVPQVDVYYLELTESIFNPFITGVFKFYDRNRIMETISMNGTEKIKIKYGRDTKIEKTFNIYTNDEVYPERFSEETILNVYVFNIVEEGFINFTQNARYSKSWVKTKISDIVKHISLHMVGIDKFKTFEESKEKIDFIMPMSTPISAIKWLIGRASGVETGLPGYLLYSNAKGKHFVTIEKLLSSKEVETENGKVADYKFGSTEKFYPNKIVNFRHIGVDNTVLRNLRGGIKSGFDTEINRYIEYKWKYNDIVTKYTSFGRYTLLPDVGTENAKNEFEGDVDETTLKNIAYSDFIKRYIKLNLIEVEPQFAHERRYAGLIGSIYYPSGFEKDVVNKTMNGKWLIVSVKNVFGANINGMWKQVITFSKNGYMDSNNSSLNRASKVSVDTSSKKVLKV